MGSGVPGVRVPPTGSVPLRERNPFMPKPEQQPKQQPLVDALMQGRYIGDPVQGTLSDAAIARILWEMAEAGKLPCIGRTKKAQEGERERPLCFFGLGQKQQPQP